jgi:hypothetical protein
MSAGGYFGAMPIVWVNLPDQKEATFTVTRSLAHFHRDFEASIPGC